ncbi:MAG: amidohydrolase [Chloroflexi bacterium]|nr:amidohydrolase [Chloroflexota bacterium]
MAKEGLIVLDSDMHVMEPHDLWLQYMDARYRERAPRRQQFPSGLTAWASEGRAFPAYSDHPARRAQNASRYQRAAAQGERYAEARAQGYNAQSQIKAMAIEGIDMAVCFRTLGSHVIAIDGMDSDLSAAMCRAFNRWLADYCSADTFKLKGAAALPLQDVAKAVEEARYAVEKLKMVAVVLPSNPVEHRQLYDPHYDPLWAALGELNVPVTFHGIHAAYQDHISTRYLENLTLAHASSHPVELLLSLGAMIVGGVFERFPKLQAAFLEGNCSWAPWWLWRLDEEWEKFGPGERVRLQGKPIDYFKRHCYLSVDPSEGLVRQVIEALGDDNLVFSSDWPHDDSAYPKATEKFVRLPGLTLDNKRKILWDNCSRLYRIAF